MRELHHVLIVIRVYKRETKEVRGTAQSVSKCLSTKYRNQRDYSGETESNPTLSVLASCGPIVTGKLLMSTAVVFKLKVIILPALALYLDPSRELPPTRKRTGCVIRDLSPERRFNIGLGMEFSSSPTLIWNRKDEYHSEYVLTPGRRNIGHTQRVYHVQLDGDANEVILDYVRSRGHTW